MKRRHDPGGCSRRRFKRPMVKSPYMHSASAQSRLPELDPGQLARKIVDIASDKQASDIVLLDLRPITEIADYFVICTGSSERQLGAIERDIRDTLRNEHHVRPVHVEGTPDSGWILMDYGDVVVHVFSPSQRDYYRLEDLWSAAPAVLRVQ